MSRSEVPSFEASFAAVSSLATEQAQVWEARILRSAAEASPEGVVIELFGRDRAPGEPPAAPLEGPDTTYHHWFTDNPDAVGRLSANEVVVTKRRNAWLRDAPQGGFQRLTPAWAVSAFAMAASEPSQLATVIDFTSAILDKATSPLNKELIAATQDTVVKSVKFVGETDLRLVIDAFKARPAGELKRQQIGVALGRMLINESVGGYPELVVQQVDKVQLVDAITAFGKAGLVSDEFWVQFAIKAGGAAKVPALLPLLRQALKAMRHPSPEALISSPRSMAQAYITEVLRAAMIDPLRNNDRARRILSRSQMGLPEGSIDSSRFIEEADTVAMGFNLGVRTSEDMLPLLGPGNLADMSWAFLRLMAITRGAELSPTERATQILQDAMHAEIIAVVCGGRPTNSGVGRGDIVLQNQAATEEQIKRIQTQVAAGRSWLEVLRRELGEQP